jgi:hypothetical protein
MNARIRELIEQAYEHQPLMVVNPKTYQVEHKIGHGEAPMYHRVFNQEKFALLIVGECEAILKKDDCKELLKNILELSDELQNSISQFQEWASIKSITRIFS